MSLADKNFLIDQRLIFGVTEVKQKKFDWYSVNFPGTCIPHVKNLYWIFVLPKKNIFTDVIDICAMWARSKGRPNF